MAVAAADLTYPVGEIRPEWFDGEDVAASLALRIAAGAAMVPAGATEPQADAVVRAYAYRETYRAKVLAMAGNPDSVGLGDLSVTNSAARIKFFEAARDRWDGELSAAVGAVAPAAAAAPVFHPSRSVARTVGW